MEKSEGGMGGREEVGSEGGRDDSGAEKWKVGLSPTSQMNMMSTMVVKGRAWVELWYQATVLSMLHTIKKGTGDREKQWSCKNTCIVELSMPLQTPWLSVTSQCELNHVITIYSSVQERIRRRKSV